MGLSQEMSLIQIEKFGNYNNKVGDGKYSPGAGQITIRILLGDIDTTVTFAALEKGMHFGN